MMQEMACRGENVRFASDFKIVYKTKKEEPVTQQFEVGDIVAVKGTVKSIDSFHRIHVKITDICTAVLLLTPDQDAVTLVERPDKFKVGQKYAHPDTKKYTYMYLGDDQWWNYTNKEVYTSKQIHPDYRNSFVPVD